MLDQNVIHITQALLRPETALAAIRALGGSQDRVALEGLVELIYHHHNSKEAVEAISALEASNASIVVDALRAALDNSHPSVRLAALQDLRRRRVTGVGILLGRLLCTDGSWPVRRTALYLLADESGDERWRTLDAADDPHWRVRHALIRVLLRWGDNALQRQEIDRRLSQLGSNERVQGVRGYLQYLWTGAAQEFARSLRGNQNIQACSFWDWDAAVLHRRLEGMEERGRRQALDAMPLLLTHPDVRIRVLAAKTVRDWGETRHLAPVVGLLDDPRQEGIGEVVKLLNELDEDRKEELARFLLHASKSTPAQLSWALDQVGFAFPAAEEQVVLVGLMSQTVVQTAAVRCALGRLAARWEHPAASEWLQAFVTDPDPAVSCAALCGLNAGRGACLDTSVLARLLGSEHGGLRTEAVSAAVRQGKGDLLRTAVVDADVAVRIRLAELSASREDTWARDVIARLRDDPHPLVRAAILTPAQAAELVKEPSRETSWHVLAAAARLARVPLWKLAPSQPWRPTPTPLPLVEPLRPRAAAPHTTRPLGQDKLALAPMGISGHYGLPVEGFVRAYEAGVNLMFWEPKYRTLTEFIVRIGPSDRAAIHLLAGTFEADGNRIRRDAERVLRTLKVEKIAIFLLFWVQSWDRVTPDVRAALERLKTEGKIASYGLSTHSRPLAIEALDAGWDPVMVRHSAAHRGAEELVFPQAVARGASIITFSNTCYGRLLEPRDGLAPPNAADCYRYTLMQPGVRACLSAPATLAQLEENLAALFDPALSAERRQHLQAVGECLYKEETMFQKFVRYL